jgi:hypothetical protein
MSIFRSRRIETVLGAPVDELTAAHIKSLVDAKVGEVSTSTSRASFMALQTRRSATSPATSRQWLTLLVA